MGRPSLLFTLAAWLLLAACSSGGGPWQTRNITGLMPDLEFTLAAPGGDAVDAQRFRGKIVLLYFGYTNCPDVCPITLAKLGKAVAALGDDADRVRVVFVSVDPARDRPRLASYARYFGSEVVGLTGSEDQLRALTKRYRVTYSLGKADEDGNYEVSHSSGVFIFDAAGKIRLLATDQDPVDAIAHDLRLLIASSS